MNINKVKIHLNKFNKKKNDKIIKDMINFLNDDIHLDTEEVFTPAELNDRFTGNVEPYSMLKVMKRRNFPEENFIVYGNHTNHVRYIFGHPELIKILKENL